MRVYIVGAGVIGRTHAEAVRKLPDRDKIALFVADPNPAALAAFTEQYPEAKPYSDAGAMLAEPAEEDDIVIIGTPPFTHYELARTALASGRHTLCEKPFVMNREQSEELLRTALERGRYIGCCSVRFLGSPKLAEVKKLLASGKLGEIYKVSFVFRNQRGRAGIEYQPESRWFLDRSKSGGGILMDWGPYDFTVLNDLFRPVSVEVVSAWTGRPVTAVDPTDTVYDIEGHVGASLRYRLADGASFWLQYERASCTHGEPGHYFEIEGTLGAVRWSPYFESDQIIYSRDVNGEVHREEITSSLQGEWTVMDRPFYEFFRLVHGEPSLALINEQAVFNFQCIQAVYQCAETGTRQIVERPGSEFTGRTAGR
jgi:predicted dehydrogenase